MVLNDEVARAKSIFLGALEQCGPNELAGFLERECQGNRSLRRQVDRLLSGHRKDVDLAQEGEAALKQILPTVATLPKEQMEVGTQIGPYKLREQLGEGGMGVVYVAEQTQPVQRKVALKLIRPGMASKDVVARFEAERQALAMMDHPNIAKVLDGGATESGQPYFVMELVQGLSITDYCDQHELSTKARLQLFATVCRAVQHAHQKGIIHRDLKPSNIVVSEIDAKAVPKVIDFGVAKAVGQKLTEGTLYTHFSQMVGTPLYMSPEQTGLGVVDIDTRSDVYSLGVLLYELLTGNTPFNSDTLKEAGFDEMRRIIREDEPPKPSAMVSTLKADALSTISQRRGSDPRTLSESLTGELDWLVMKALEKDRNQRYESASALADDVERYLADEPIDAGPPSAAYWVKKYWQRNRGRLSAAALATAVLLIGGGIAVNAQIQQTRQQREIAQEVEQSLAEARTAIETGDLGVARQRVGEAEGRIADARENLHDLAGRVNALRTEVSQRRAQVERFEVFEQLARDGMDISFSGSHDEEGLVRKALGTYDVLKDDRWFDKVQRSYLSPQQQDRLRQTAYETLLMLANMGVKSRPKFRPSETSAKESLELLRKASTFYDPTRGFYWVRSECHNFLGNDEQAKNNRQQYEATPAKIAFDYFLPGYQQGSYGHRDEAIRACEAALQLEPDHFNSLFFLALRLSEHGKHDQALGYYRACLALRPDHVPSLRLLSGLLAGQRRYSDALELANKACELAPSAVQYECRAGIFQAKGDLHLALEDLVKAVEVAEPDEKALGSAHLSRAAILAELGRLDEAILSFTKGIELPSNVMPGMDYVQRGQIYYAQGRHQEAIADYNRAIEAFSGPGPKMPPDSRAQTYMNRSTIQWSAGNYEDSIAGIRKAIEVFPDNADLYRNLALKLLSRSDAGRRDYSEALELATKAVELEPENEDREKLALAQYRTGDFDGAVDTYIRMSENEELDAEKLLVLAMAHHQLGHQEEAREWYAKGLKEYPKTLNRIAKIFDPDSAEGIPDKNLKEGYIAYLTELRSEAEQLLGITEEDIHLDSDDRPPASETETDQAAGPSSDGEAAQPTDE